MPLTDILCIYHARCLDGFGAAWAFHDHLRRQGLREKATFIPALHHAKPPDATGREVWLVDFAWPRAVMAELARVATRVHVIDHHTSVVRDLAGLDADLPNLELHLDESASGAMLVWRYFNPQSEPPALLRHIEDRDLWRFALPDTREINMALFERAFDFDQWDALIARGNDAILELASHGRVLNAKFEQDVERLVRNAAHTLVIDGHTVPALNVPAMYASAAGDKLAHNAPFSVTYHHIEGKTLYSLRSHPGGMDVSVIAARFGGGGHTHAAGFSLPRPTQTLDVAVPRGDP